jgi:hypothetical protein
MEAICSSETSVDTQRTTRLYIPEDGTLQTYLCCMTLCFQLKNVISGIFGGLLLATLPKIFPPDRSIVQFILIFPNTLICDYKCTCLNKTFLCWDSVFFVYLKIPHDNRNIFKIFIIYIHAYSTVQSVPCMDGASTAWWCQRQPANETANTPNKQRRVADKKLEAGRGVLSLKHSGHYMYHTL